MNNLVQPKDFPTLVQPFDLTRQSTALIIIDMQNFAVNPDYGWGPFLLEKYPEIASFFFDRITNIVVPNIGRLLALFRRNDLRIIYCTVGPHLLDGSDFNRSRSLVASSGHAPEVKPMGTPEHNIIEQLIPKQGEIVLNKVSRGAFSSTGIDLILRNLGCDTLIFTGVHTNGCVETTARQAVDMGYKTILVNDAMACFEEEMHQATIRTFGLLLGQVLDTAEIIKQLDQPSNPQRE